MLPMALLCSKFQIFNSPYNYYHYFGNANHFKLLQPHSAPHPPTPISDFN